MGEDAGPSIPERSGARMSGRNLGLAAGIAAYTSWGIVPLYFKAVAAAPPLEVLAHRVVWALVMLVCLLAWQRRLPDLLAALRPGRTLAMLAASTILIALNWLVYIWAVAEGRVLDGSLGYFMTPLVNVVLGVAVLRERIERPVAVAVTVAAAGVLYLAASAAHAPWTSLILAGSFGGYGLLRKLAPVGATVGLTVETALLCPAGLVYLLWMYGARRLSFGVGNPRLDLLLILAGPVTAVPLIFFAAAARRLPLTTLGFLQYLSPTLQFLLAVFLWKEPLPLARVIAFACIWIGLAIFTVHSARRASSRRRGSAPPSEPTAAIT
jgi:chloramphenicol-sensitive protein RarD